MEYRYRDFDFESDLEFYRIITADIASPYIKNRKGLCLIYYPKGKGAFPRITTQFREILFTYSGVTYQLKSLDPVSLTIIEISDLDEDIVDWGYNYLRILSPKITIDLVRESFEKSGLFIEVAINDQPWQYKEVINLLVNKTINCDNLNLLESPIKLIDTKDRYLFNQTIAVNAVHERFKMELENKFYLKALNETQETKTREVATIQFDDYQKDYFRLLPQTYNELTNYIIPMKLVLNTTSVSKFERMLSEFNTLKFMSNIVRVFAEDRIGNVWTINLKWEQNPETNSTSDAKNDRNEASYQLGLSFYMQYYDIRSNKYQVIRDLLLNYISKPKIN